MLHTLIASALLLIDGTAVAAEPDQPQAHQPTMAQATAVDEFTRLDVNKDSVLSRAELARHPKAAHMAMVDENQDGVLSREEFAELEQM
jgi:Ca2+-binding EF-hand superfamily protein